ncbi:MAG: non-canonical purine NTP pyrophosphatase, partial [Herbaspirillum sp.]
MKEKHLLMTIVLASSNQGKYEEFAALLGGIGLDVRLQSVFNLWEADEPFTTFVENALTKA